MAARTTDERTGADLTPFTWSVLNISTVHIRQTTAEALGTGTACTAAPLWDHLAYTPWADYGWIISVDDFSWLREDFPDLHQVMRFAFDHGFDYLQFDADGRVYPSLPTYDWS